MLPLASSQYFSTASSARDCLAKKSVALAARFKRKEESRKAFLFLRHPVSLRHPATSCHSVTLCHPERAKRVEGSSPVQRKGFYTARQEPGCARLRACMASALISLTALRMTEEGGREAVLRTGGGDKTKTVSKRAKKNRRSAEICTKLPGFFGKKREKKLARP